MTLDALITRVLAETHSEQNPYFVALQDGSLSKEDFVESQAQFYFAVTFFSRPMAAVAAKVPDAKQRVELLRNVWEEHGEGESSATHTTTFETFMHRLAEVTPDDLRERVLWPEVRIFNTTLAGAAVLDEYIVSVGMMGMIERMFSDISAWIGQSVVERGWFTKDQLIHYNLHQELDVRHSDDFFDVLRPRWEGSEEDRYYIEQGLRLGASVFYGLYEGLYRARARRWRTQTRGPHSRA